MRTNPAIALGSGLGRQCGGGVRSARIPYRYGRAAPPARYRLVGRFLLALAPLVARKDVSVDSSRFDALTRMLATSGSRRRVVGGLLGGGLALAGLDRAGADNLCKPAGKKCNKDSQCCSGLACAGGQCTDLCAGVVCPAPDQCRLPGACDPSTGVCSYPAKPDGTACDDGSACTEFDTCQSGVCVGAVSRPGVECGNTYRCSVTVNGVVSYHGNYSSCDPCVPPYECIRNQHCCCISDADCEDGNPCTSDTCVPGPAGGCVSEYVAPGEPCPDGTCDGNGSCEA